MGSLTRAFDWTSSVLGHPNHWPQPLRTAVALLLASKFPMFLWWGEQLIQFYNDAYRPSLGAQGKHPAALGQAGSVCWPEIWPTIKPLLDQVFAGGEATWSENQLIPIERNGRLEDVYWTFSYTPIHNEWGPVGGVLVVCQETTQAVLTQRQLKQSEAHFRRIVEQAPMAIGMLRGRDMIIDVGNDIIFEVWGKDRSVIGKRLIEVLPELRDQVFMGLLESVYDTGIPWMGYSTPAKLVRQGRLETVFFDIIYTPIRSVEETITGVMILATDVSQQVAARLTIDRSAQAIQEADRRKDEFLAMLGHELRNPLAPLRHALHLLRRTDGAHQDLTPVVDLMTRQVDHLVRLVDDLLDVSRINQGKIELRLERLELGELITQAVETIRPQYELGGRTLTLTRPGRATRLGGNPPEPIYLQGDPTRLNQVITNLLTNALRYTQPGGYIEVSVERVGEQALVRVADDGIGLEAHQLGAIFELFVQVHTGLDQALGGLGLGLPVVKRLVEGHGGGVSVQSAGLGHGSEFLIYLPVLVATPEPSPIPRPTLGQDLKGRRVLVVDDNQDAALMLSMLLRRHGHEVSMCYDGRTGIEAAERLHPEVVLLDIGMPTLTGYATCQLIRQQPWGQFMVLIALTGYGQPDDKRRSLEAGFDAHVTKPVELAALLELLDRLPTHQHRIKE